MTLQIQSPYIHVEDSNGNPYVGATLAVYQAGTTTYADIYSDDGLSVALPNPLSGDYASDAAGNFPRVYIAAGTYKLRAETSAGVLIFQEDDIDTGLSAGTGALPISRGGTGATTAAAARSALDVPSNSELTALSTSISSLSAQIQNVVSIPQGYLTLTTSTPAITGDVSAATSVYYTPDIGVLVPIWSGSSFTITTFAELTMALNANHLANQIYDFFIINDAGTVRLVTGPAWSGVTAGSCSRGTGAGTTELERVSGIYVNKNSMTARYGATTVTVDANKGTYVGSLYMDGTNGQVSCHRTWGASRKWGVWNYYNRKRIMLKVGDSTASWTYSTNTIRQSNGATGNKATPFVGIQDECIRGVFSQNGSVNNSTVQILIGFGIDSTTAISGKEGRFNPAAGTAIADVVAMHESLCSQIGISNWNLLESGNGNTVGTFLGTETFMKATIDYFG